LQFNDDLFNHKIFTTMKNLFLLLLFLAFSMFSYAQADRRVMVEEATNASCGPCASQNPAFDALLQQNADMVTVLKYHASWPGYDPMYNHNQGENDSRISYYGINSVPRAIVGGVYNGAPANVTQSMLNSYAAAPSPFEEIDIYQQLSDNQDSLFVFMRIRAAQNISESGMKAMCAVVEKQVNFSSPPGSNGEKNFLDVMKKMLPNASGTPLQTNWQDGEYSIVAVSWELENVYNIDQLGVVGFVQNNTTKTIHQSGVSSNEPFEALSATDAAAVGISNVTTKHCAGYLVPQLAVASYGTNDITSLEIRYNVNDGPEQALNWNGNVGYLKIRQIELPQINFEVLDENVLTIYLASVNGGGDDYRINDTIRKSFERAPVVEDNVILMIKLDSNPEETTWEITNDEGLEIFSGGPYSNPNTLINLTLEFEVSDCYRFTIYDAAGNGLQSPGFFTLFKGNPPIISGSAFGSMASVQFSGEVNVGIAHQPLPDDVAIYPNPAMDAMQISLSTSQPADVDFLLMNQTGQVVHTIMPFRVEAGLHQTGIDLTRVPAGIYFLQMNLDGRRLIKKVIVMK
jgi:hypothetical protein